MNVGQLRKILDNPELEDTDLVVLQTPDLNYADAYPEFITLLEDSWGGMFVDHGEEKTPEATHGTRKKAIVFRKS